MVEEINQFDKESTEDQKKVAAYKKTSMKKYMSVFEDFLNDLSKENAERRREENGKTLKVFKSGLLIYEYILFSI